MEKECILPPSKTKEKAFESIRKKQKKSDFPSTTSGLRTSLFCSIGCGKEEGGGEILEGFVEGGG